MDGTVAIRRVTRVGKRFEDPLEDIGVIPNKSCRLTRRDVLEGNRDLFATAIELLKQWPQEVTAYMSVSTS